jgi:invasion associated locus B (IalB) protein
MFRGIHDMGSMRRRALAGSAAVALCALAAPALAQSAPTNLGTFKTWTAWQGQDDYGKICFISAAPDKSDPTTVNGKPIVRDPPHFLIIHRDKAPAVNPDGTAAKDKNGNPVFRKVRNEVQTLIGYPLQPTTSSTFHTAVIDGKAWNMKSIPDDPATPIKDNEAAWLASMSDEAGFVTAIKNGSSLVVNGTSLRGTKTADTYSLSGVTAAMQAIDKACP